MDLTTKIRWAGRVIWTVGGCALALFLTLIVLKQQTHSIDMRRNFYGVLRVDEFNRGTRNWLYSLWNGQILHGGQIRSGPLRYRGTTYYGPESGIALAIENHPKRIHSNRENPTSGKSILRIGGVGLGVGTISTYGREGDFYRFYEINPQVIEVANQYFTYLEDTAADYDIVLGDARISLERELNGEAQTAYDILAVDVFNGDAIPVHLLTREAFALYIRHLRPDGILAIHISNIYLDLAPLVRALAEEMGQDAVWIENKADEAGISIVSQWVLVTRNREFLESEPVKRAIKPWPNAQVHIRVWTDDYSNLVQLLD